MNKSLRWLLLTALLLLARTPLVSSHTQCGPFNWKLCLDADPLNEPDKFAWELFVDISKPLADGTNKVAWENWALDTEIFTNPQKTPVWPQFGRSEPKPEPLLQLQMFDDQLSSSISNKIFSPSINSTSQTITDVPEKRQHVHVNKPAFDFIVNHHLWYVEGQEEAVKHQISIDFPRDSIEVKAVWEQLETLEQLAQKAPRFHCRTFFGVPHCLIALHITSKAVPNWTWATFEHTDNPERCNILNCIDRFGAVPSRGKNTRLSRHLLQMFDAAGLSDVWKNYRLSGTQTDFTDSTGRPTLLGNSVPEGRFLATSSCITCHARSAVNQKGEQLPAFKCFPSQEGNSGTSLCTQPVSFNGTPDPGWFYDKSGQVIYLQRDFVWSLSKARRRETDR